MEIRFDNKIVLITGSSRGIGAATAHKFAEAGATVVTHYVKGVDKARQNFNKLHGSCHMMLQADLSEPEDVRRLFDKIIRQKERIDILVNNAGIYEETRWWELEYEEWQQHWKKTIDTNLTGMANLIFPRCKTNDCTGWRERSSMFLHAAHSVGNLMLFLTELPKLQ